MGKRAVLLVLNSNLFFECLDSLRINILPFFFFVFNIALGVLKTKLQFLDRFLFCFLRNRRTETQCVECVSWCDFVYVRIVVLVFSRVELADEIRSSDIFTFYIFSDFAKEYWIIFRCCNEELIIIWYFNRSNRTLMNRNL